MTAKELFSRPKEEVKKHFQQFLDMPPSQRQNLGLDIKAVVNLTDRIGYFPRVLKKPGEMIERIGNIYYVIFDGIEIYNLICIKFSDINDVKIEWFRCEWKTGSILECVYDI